MSLLIFEANFAACRIDKFALKERFVAMPGRAKVLTPQEFAEIFRLLKTARNQALFALRIYTGMRISEKHINPFGRYHFNVDRMKCASNID